jgi:hypothetical protein
MAAFMSAHQAKTLYAMGLITDDELRHYISLAEWRKILTAGANTTTTTTTKENDPCPPEK